MRNMMKLKEFREHAGLSQQEAARLLNIDRTILSRLENGKRKIDPILLFKMAKLYHTSPENLMGIQPKKRELAFVFRDAEKLDGNAKQVLDKISKIMQDIIFLKEILDENV